MKKSRTVRPPAGVESPTTRRLPLVELLIDTEAELFDLAVRSGLQVLDAMLEEDRTAICGPRYAHQADRTASRAGTVASTVVLGGRKVINDNYFCRSPRTGLAGSWVMAAACETVRFPCGGRVGHECTGSAIARETDVRKDIGGSSGGGGHERADGAHLLAGSRSNHQPLPSEAARSATALRERPQADVHAVWSSASSEPAATPTERCVVERAAVRTGKNS